MTLEGWVTGKMRSVSVCLGFHNTITQAGGLRQQKSDFSQSRRLEVQDPGVSKVGFS